MLETSDILIEFRSDPALLKPVRHLVRAYLDSLGLSADRRDDVVLAVDEACANAIRHSYQGDNDRPIELSFTQDSSGVTIVLRDEGLPPPKARVHRGH